MDYYHFNYITKLEKKEEITPYYICVFVIFMVLCVMCVCFRLFSAEGLQSSKLLNMF